MEKNKKLMFVIIAMLVVLIGVIVGVSVYAIRLINADKTESNSDPIVYTQDVTFMQTEEYTFEKAMTINLKEGEDGVAHAISLSIGVVFDISTKDKDELALIEKIKASETTMKDVVNYVVAGKTINQVKGNEAQDMLKEEILQRMRDEFQTNRIYKIIFGDIYYL